MRSPHWKPGSRSRKNKFFKPEAAPAASKATQSLPRSPAPFHATHAPALLCGGAFLFPGGVV